MGEGCLAHDPLGHHAARDGDFTPVVLLEILLDLFRVGGHVEAADLKRILSRVLQSLQLFPAYPDQVAYVFFLRHRSLRLPVVLSHVSFFLPLFIPLSPRSSCARL